jgi:hypothetical protein
MNKRSLGLLVLVAIVALFLGGCGCVQQAVRGETAPPTPSPACPACAACPAPAPCPVAAPCPEVKPCPEPAPCPKCPEPPAPAKKVKG